MADTDETVLGTDGDDTIVGTAVAGICGFEDLTITADGSAAVIDLTAQGGGTIRLDHTNVAEIDAGDFLFTRRHRIL